MRKVIIVLGVLASLSANAQGRVGINTENPRATLDIVGRPIEATTEDEKIPRGVIFPHISEEHKQSFQNIPEGLMIWNTTKKCLDYWNGTVWRCAGEQKEAIIPKEEKETFKIPSDLTILAGKYMIGSIYDENYYPFSRPTTEAIWTAVPADKTNENYVVNHQGVITEEGIEVHIPISYIGTEATTLLAYTSPEVAIDPEGDEDNKGTSTRKIILRWEEQVITNATKHIVAIIKTTAGSGVLNVRKLDINGGIGKDNQGVLLAKFGLKENNSEESNTVDFEVRAIAAIPDRNYNVKTKVNNILDYNHQFLYLPIQGPDGRTWLSNNLGADYTNVKSAEFNLTFQAGNKNPEGYVQNGVYISDVRRDHRAFGSLFQWQRQADGHELVKWTLGEYDRYNRRYDIIGEAIDKEFGEASDNENWIAGHSHFVLNNSATGQGTSWVIDKIQDSPNNKTLWQKGGANNPCPVGYHVPTREEWLKLYESLEVKENGGRGGILMWNVDKVLRIPAAGHREGGKGANPQGRISLQGQYAWYWTSTDRPSAIRPRTPDQSAFDYQFNNMVYNSASVAGMPIRCIADE